MTATEDPEREDAKAKPFWASFTAADARMLVVTIAGTAIGTIFSVMLIALAVIVVRSEHGQGPTAGVIALVGILVVFEIAVIKLAGWWLKWLGRRAGLASRRTFPPRYVIPFLWLMASLVTAMLILVLLGEAVGISK